MFALLTLKLNPLQAYVKKMSTNRLRRYNMFRSLLRLSSSFRFLETLETILKYKQLFNLNTNYFIHEIL